MSEEEELEKWRKERGIPDEEFQRLHSPELRMLYLLEKLTERVMTNEVEARRRDEKMERHIDFIIQQQAQFITNMQQLGETQATSERRWERTEGSVRDLLAIAQSHEGEISALREAMAETDERLNALINVVERRISEERNGGNPDAGDG